MISLQVLLLLASTLTSTTYGYGEGNCGEVGQPMACSVGAITASGDSLKVSVPQLAVAAPSGMVLRGQFLGVRLVGRRGCYKVRLVDKMNERWIGVRGFDLNPAAVQLLTGKTPSSNWSGRVEVCNLK